MSHIDLSQNPYFDDFDESKEFYRILFRPGKAVQGRELTQLQTILQNQISRFGGNIFQQGSMVRGAATTLELQNISYIKLEPSFNSLEVDLSTFVNKFIVDTSGLGIRAYVIATQEATDITPKTLIVKYVSAAQVDNVTTVTLQTDDGNFNATTYGIAPVVGSASICSIDEGTFFINGFFAFIAAQTIVLEAYNNTPSYRIGLQIDDSIVDETQDSSLLDPAVGASNYQAPGATRYKINLTFSKRPLDSTDDSLFIELLRVDNGQLIKKITYPLYSVIEDTMARRTFDESGNYTVTPFNIALKPHDTFANAYNVILEAGKAYVLGYEFATLAPTYIKAERARDVANVYHYNLTLDYENYVDVTRLSGPIPLSTFAPLTLHCVTANNINTVSAALASATAIGTIRIRAMEYVSGANTTSVNTAIWRAYVLDANVTNRTANATGGSANTIILDASASKTANAYVGMELRIVANAGINVQETHVIGSYNGTTQTATLAGTDVFAFGVPSAATLFSLDYEFKDAHSIVLGSSNVITTQMDIDSSSIDPITGTFITDTNFNTLLFKFPYPMIADSTVVNGVPISNSQYTGRRLYSGQNFSSNVISLTTTAGIVSAVNGSPLSTDAAMDNIKVVIKSPGSGTIANNQVINFESSANSVTVTTAGNTSTYTITVPGAQNAIADVYVKVTLPFSATLGSLLRSKTLAIANTANVSTTSPISVAPGITWFSQAAGANGAQINFAANAISTLQSPNQPQSVYVADGYTLDGVFDFGTNAITQANLASATNITSAYILDSGQRDNSYDHASIRLKPTSAGPKGNVVVYVSYLNHSGLGYLTADSYQSANIPFTQIPVYTSPVTGVVYPLRDTIDFRPRRKNADIVGEFDEVILPISQTNFETDFSHYLARIDKVMLNKDQTFEISKGIPSLTPVPPADKDNSMTLYSLSLPPFTANTRDISVTYVDNKRYTMRDIGTLEKRISTLEYYTSLSLAEKAATDQEILDSTGLPRFKNGILVDPFTGHNIGDVLNPDYHCAIDTQNNELRPPFAIQNIGMDFDTPDSSNYARHGSIFTLPYTEQTLVDQPFASLAINVNPFNTVAFIGTIQLDPSSDTWVDTNQAPDVLVNLGGNNDAWAALAAAVNQINPGKIFGTVWNSWQTQWTGISPPQTDQYYSWYNAPGDQYGYYVINRTTVDVTQHQIQTGVTTSFVPQTIQQSIGNKVVDVSIVPYIRSRGVLFVGKMFLPNTTLYPFFDDTSVQNYVNIVNIVQVNSNTATYIDTYQNGETVRIFDSVAGINTAFAVVARTQNYDLTTNVSIVNLTAGDDGFIQNVKVIGTNATFLIGETSGSNTRISGYFHSSGIVKAATANTITLENDVIGSNTNSTPTNFVGKTIYFTSGNGISQSGVIASYNVTTANAVLTTPLTTLPDSNTTYSFGQLQSDAKGECIGVFIIPSTPTVRFRTGERVFRLIDNINNTLNGSMTNGDVKYYSEGLLETLNNTVISTRVPSIERTALQQERAVTSTVVTDSQIVAQIVVGYWDPLAQTFLVNQNIYPSGVQVTGLRLIFKTKDPDIPLRVELRPVVNGFPSSALPIPGSQTVIDPSDIIEVSEDMIAAQYANSISNNPLDNASLYTEVKFQSPIFLQPGAEYAMIVMANSIKYQIYAAQMGQNLIGTNRLISEQPYLGSLFKSQNSTTWSPIQDQDLLFRLLNAQYNISSKANLQFILAQDSAPTSNVPMDVFYVTTGNLVLPNTTLESLVATTTSTGVKEVARSFQISDNSYFDDTLGRRVITPDVSSFQVRLLLSSLSQDISPVVDLDRLSVLAIQNLANNDGLSNSSFVILNSSTNYIGSNVSVSISGGGGTGANAYAVIVSNTLSSIIADQSGSGYTGTPIVTVTGGGGTANVVVVGEDQPSGGPSLARYITRMVTLADGMDAGDFRVYFNAYKPLEATIDVYYKILSADDPSIFDTRNYQPMTIITGYNNISLNSKDFKSFVYAPGTNNIAADRVQYGTFTSFKYFAIKIVMRSTDTTRVPRIRDFRVVAIPSL